MAETPPLPTFRLLLLCVGLSALARLDSGPAPMPPDRIAARVGPDTAFTASVTEAVPGRAVAFVPNRGQWDSAVRYLARVGPLTMFLEDRGWTLALTHGARRAELRAGSEPMRSIESARRQGAAVRMHFEGGEAPVIVAEERLPGYRNYFIGNDPARWRSHVPGFAALRYAGMYPGIDVRIRQARGRLEYDLILAPGVDLRQVVIRVEGAEELCVDVQGALVVDTALGPVVQPAPTTWEVDERGSERHIDCDYVRLGPNRFGFAAPDWSGERALVIDPQLVWSTYLGGTGIEWYANVAIDPSGAATIAGGTESTNYPVTPGAFDPTFGGQEDGVITRLDASQGGLVWSTYLGGSGFDRVEGLAVDPLGVVTAIGSTQFSQFPTTPGALRRTSAGGDAFVTRLAADGASLIWSTLLGGSGGERAFDLALDPTGVVTLTGETSSNDFPTTPGAFDRSNPGGLNDAFVTRMNATGSALVWSTYLGGSGDEQGTGLAIDPSGDVTVVGFASQFARSYPTTPGALFMTHQGGIGDAVVSRLDPTGSTLLWSTYLGGTNYDAALDVVVDATGTATVSGGSSSLEFPTTPGAWGFGVTTPGSFVTRFAPTGALVWSARVLAGANNVALDATGCVTAVGSTFRPEFTTTPGAWDRTLEGDDTAAWRLDPTGAALLWSTLLGGSGSDSADEFAIDGTGNVTIVGRTDSVNFPTTPGAWSRSRSGPPGFIPDEYFVTRLPSIPAGVRRYGSYTRGCNGAPTSHALDDAVVGSPTFGLACSQAPVAGSGALLLAARGLTVPVAFLGADLWVDPGALLLVVPVASEPSGETQIRMPVPARPALRGGKFDMQFLWVDACAPAGLSASDALEITLQ